MASAFSSLRDLTSAVKGGSVPVDVENRRRIFQLDQRSAYGDISDAACPNRFEMFVNSRLRRRAHVATRLGTVGR